MPTTTPTGTVAVAGIDVRDLVAWVAERYAAGWRRLQVTDWSGRPLAAIDYDPRTGRCTWSVRNPDPASGTAYTCPGWPPSSSKQGSDPT